MMCIFWVDFTGTEAELKEVDKAYKDAAGKTKGVEYMGRYTSLGQKWNWSYFFKIDNMGTMDEFFKNVKYKRDYSKFTHGAVEFFSGPS